jgi:hypothetical protein
MLGTHLESRRRLAGLVGLCLILSLAAVPAAIAVPIDEGHGDGPALVPSPDGFASAPASTGVDWGSVVLVVSVCLAVAVAAAALVTTIRRRRPLPAARL